MEDSSYKDGERYRKIGFGQCGLVYERPLDGVVKVARRGFQDSLLNNWRVHLRVYEAFSRDCPSPLFTPKPISHVPMDSPWWQSNAHLFHDTHEAFQIPSAALLSTRIPPLPKPYRNLIIDYFCPADTRETARSDPANGDALARVYLGRRGAPGAPPPANFSLRNYNLTLDQLLALGFPVENYADYMGKALAVMHWGAGVDAYDVEFVLGGLEEPGTNCCRMWVLDFNLCTAFEAADVWKRPAKLLVQLVAAFFENDPYFPRPMMDDEIGKWLWKIFSGAYLRESRRIGTTLSTAYDGALPRVFLRECEMWAQDNLRKGLEHGHRENTA